MKRSYLVFPPLLAVLITLCPPQHRPWEGICQQVLDGDTLVVAGRLVRLAFIDAPEREQRSRWGVPVGQQAASFLRNLVLHRKLLVRPLSIGHYGRWIALVSLAGEGSGGGRVNWQMVLAGHAFAFSPGKKPPPLFSQAQSLARARGLGFWAHGGVAPPWRYRRWQQKALPSRGGRREIK